jgi:hypothetical protein
MARAGRHPERILLLFEPNALLFELRGKGLAVGSAGLLLGLVEIAADDGAPGAVAARGEVEDEGVRAAARAVWLPVWSSPFPAEPCSHQFQLLESA